MARLLNKIESLARSAGAARRAHKWPDPRWQKDPVGFARQILGVDLWQFQKDFLEGIRDNRHVSVAGGRKIGKDFAVACASIWWYSSFPEARVFLLAPTAKQLDGILYREVRMLWAQAGRCLDCKRKGDGPRPCPHSSMLVGRVGQLARTGIKADDFREILGATAVSEGALRGFSGARVLAIEDEASDIKDEFDTALIGNLAGADCHRVLISNPTRTIGFFYESFHSQRDLYHTMQVSSESCPNVVEGANVFRGLADRQWISEREIAWGRGSPNWQANVEGKFVRAEAGQLFSLDEIAASESRWEDAPAEGRLYIGVDVAGAGQDGDETAFAVRRGRKVLELYAARGLGPEAVRKHALDLVVKWRQDWEKGSAHADELPVVVVDRDGLQGTRVYEAFAATRATEADNHAETFDLLGFRGNEPPRRMGDVYRLTRDALFGGLKDAFLEGLAIPPDTKLEAELMALRWIDNERGKQVLVGKSELRDRLGRSPDRCDALALSTWGSWRDVRQEEEAVTRKEGMRHVAAPPAWDDRDRAPDVGGGLDPYRSFGR